jgi:hypothetical protein
MTDNHILITSDGELAVPFDAPSVEHDPGRHLTTAIQPAGDLALIPIAGSIAIGLLVGEEAGFYIGLTGLVIGLITLLAFRSLRLEVYETGMKISGWNRRTYWIWWDEITEIKHLKEKRWMGGLDNIGNTYLELSLYVRDKLVFTLPYSITERYDLNHVIVRHVEKSLLEYYSRILPEGKAIAMGPIRIEQAGIRIRDDFLRWEDIESLERDKDVFILKTSNKTYRITFKRNQDVLQRLFSNAMAGEIGVDRNAMDRIRYIPYGGSYTLARYIPSSEGMN